MISRSLFALLLAATLLSFVPQTADAECKNKYPNCRFYNTEIKPFYKNSWTSNKESFEYYELLKDSEHAMQVIRYYQSNWIMDQARGNRIPNSNVPFKLTNTVYANNNDTWNKRSRFGKKDRKALKKFQKKGSLFMRAVDVVYELREVDGLPLLRVGVRPLNFDYAAGIPLSGYVSVPLFSANDRNKKSYFRSTIPYTVKLPDLTGAKKGDLRFSEWQFCEPCARSWLKSAKAKFLPDDSNSSIQLREHGRLPVGAALPVYVYDLSVRKKVTEDMVFSGDAAFAAAIELREKERLAQAARDAEERRLKELAERYADDRKAYDAYVADVRAGSIWSTMKKACKELKLYNAPNPRARGSHSGWFEDNAERNANSYQKHVECVKRTLDNYDFNARAETLKASADELPVLFAAAHYEDREMAKFSGTRKEVDRVRKYLGEQSDRYSRLQRDFDRAWQDMLVVFEERRERRISKEVDKCIAGLAMTNSLTPNSRSYCRSMAEKGYTGLSAAVAGFQGNKSSGSSGGAPSYTKPLVPKFDLNGMIANAQAVADGADSSLLWNEDGTVRTTVAAEAVAFQQRQQAERQRAERERQRAEREQRSTPAPIAAPTASVGDSLDRAASAADSSGSVGTVEKVADTATSGETAKTDQGGGINITVTTTSPTAEQMAALEQGKPIPASPGSDAAPAQGGSKVDSGQSSTGSASGTVSPPEPPKQEEPKKPKKPVKYVWVDDLIVADTWPASSRERAVKDFEGTLSQNDLSDFCRKVYSGDAQNGIENVDFIELEERPGGWWKGKVQVDGYCRVFAHHKLYDSIRWCPSNTRGHADCAVTDRH